MPTRGGKKKEPTPWEIAKALLTQEINEGTISDEMDCPQIGARREG
jgi:hypothetical protein